jgi:DNA-directed RNA polymerase subunit N (RpoN/RPB10)
MVPVYTICFSCSQILALLFMPFVFLAPRFWLSCLYHLFFLLPDFGSPVYTICFSCSQILALLFIPFVFLAARKTNGINRRAKIWEQEKQMA